MEKHDRSLIGHGRMSWSAARELLGAARCTWMDLDGLHVGPAPEAVPVSTHLWAWCEHAHYRVRIDGQEVVVAELVARDREDRRGGERVDVVSYEPRIWPEGEGRLSAETRRVLPESAVVHEVRDLVPIQFLEVAPNGG